MSAPGTKRRFVQSSRLLLLRARLACPGQSRKDETDSCGDMGQLPTSSPVRFRQSCFRGAAVGICGKIITVKINRRRPVHECPQLGMIALMSNRANGLRVCQTVWRRLVGAVLALAVALQALLVAVGGFSLTTNADQSPPAFELCSHDANGATQSPAKLPDHSGCTHCIFCFAGAHHVVICAMSSAFHRVNVATVVVLWRPERFGLRRVTRHTIAGPRGPPLRA